MREEAVIHSPYVDIFYDVLEMLVFLSVLTLLVRPVGAYMARVYEGERTFLSFILGPLERIIYKVAGIRPAEEMDWKLYAVSMLAFNALGIVVLFALLILQGHLPLNPQQFSAFAWPLAINTAVSFVTNTNWQAYSGEAAAGSLVQMAGLAVQNFLSAATGMAVVIALIRGFARRQSASIGNFWADLTRGTLYVLLPLAFVASVVLVSQGVIQNFKPNVRATLVEPYRTAEGKAILEQTLPMGPVASQEAIKMVGTNGGGFFNANSAHPYENPTPLSNILEILMMALIPASLTYTFGRMVKHQRQGWAIYMAMMIIFVVALGTLYWAEASGNPLISKLGVGGPYLEGKEVRFGMGGTALFSTLTTAISCGAVNAMHDSLTPIGGLVPMVLILLGEIILGGVGSGLYTMLAFAIIAVFIAGLMIGRTPEYLGKKIGVLEIWASMGTVLSAGIVVLIFTAIALTMTAGLSSIMNPGPHGLSEVLYAFASMANNNGSAFAGLNANTSFYNLMGAAAMLIGRFVPAVAILVMAGSLAGKKYIPPTVGTLPTHQAPFILWLVAVVLIVGALTYFPALAMGPVIEQFIMQGVH